MLIPLSWLKTYVPITVSPQKLAQRLTMAGIEIEGVEETGVEWGKDKVLVGHVLSVEPHPNADRLKLPTLDIGNGETAMVVCGGPNLAVGQKIAFAREGAILRSNRSGKVEPLKASKIRGVLSAGMVCSRMELGLGEDHDGILVLDEEAVVGTPLVEYLGDAVLDADVTPNRPDCLSMLGIAREVAAITGETTTEPDLSFPEDGPLIAERVAVELADPELCHRYTAGLVTSVTVGPSPEWLQKALSAAGLRPINNIVDVTNYVMLEYGQPLHAFDFDTLKDGKVVVRQARDGETLAALDDQTHKLRSPMLVIADSTDVIALAGVIGGVPTSVTDGTKNILLESASFDRINTYRTRKAIGDGTDASYRFERGVRPALAPKALRRAIGLILEVTGGTAATGIVDVYPEPEPEQTLMLSGNRMRQVLGVELSMDDAVRTLGSLGFDRIEGDSTLADQALVKIPYWRSDVAIEDDLVEEVARIIGYDSIPTTMMATPIPHHDPQPQRVLRERVRDALAASGMTEVITYPLTDRETLELVGGLPDEEPPLEIANPMNSEERLLRTSLRGAVLRALGDNRRVSQTAGLRLFEIGRVFLSQEKARGRDLPHEKERIVGVVSGPRNSASWLAAEYNMDFFDAKGVLQSIFAQIGAIETYERSTDPAMHPGKTASLMCSGVEIGIVGEVHPQVLEKFDLEGHPVAMFEIDLESLLTAVERTRDGYAAVSRFPESERDLALLVDADVQSSRIQHIIRRHKLVKASTPFDVYSGEGVQEGKRSIAYRITFQSDRSTLTTELVDRAQGDILRQLQRQLGAELRT
ncbi:MAG: phenylalanine--tRNA ligase subunit beta [SAR202 cluster bacterium]|nr:phenylalanine--tRNA ligase subunit beta [SAR202 cluster bacterium]